MKNRTKTSKVLLSFLFGFFGCIMIGIPAIISSSGNNIDSGNVPASESVSHVNEPEENTKIDDFLEEIPDYSGSPRVEINHNVPFFPETDKTRKDAFEIYSPLDSLGRCGVAYANICKEIQPTEPRGTIGSVRPSGWHTVKYNSIIDGNYLYNRCHLIGYQLAGENGNVQNLITGTRYLNVVGMLPLENEVEDYVSKSGNHVLYRVTPVFEGNNLVASGVLMEAYSVEDNGAGIQFCYYCYNVQPGISIDYATGESAESKDETDTETGVYYIVNATNRKVHKSTCSTLPKDENQIIYNTLEEVREAGYTDSCGNCHPF